MPFPPDFLWGAATSSYQIEGGVREDGRGESIWDRFSHTPGAVERGENGDVAADHYRRWADDVDLMAELGLRGYRFSIAWPRIFPDGDGRLEPRGLDFYSRLVDRLRERGIAPVPTLYHWDLPQALQDRYGGWAGRDTAERFAEYADAVFRALGDRASLWITLNEPAVAAFDGHLLGLHAPGLRDLATAVRASHHLLLGHGLAVQAFRAAGLGGSIGIALNLYPTYPATDSEADLAAARASEGFTNRWFLDPVFGRGYPRDTLDLLARGGADVAFATDADVRVIGSGIDFLGINYYHRHVVAASADGFGWRETGPQPGVETTTMNWEVVPDSMVDLFAGLRRDYPRIATYITENGASFDDVIGPDGRVEDPRRVEFLRRHIAAAEQVLAEGIDLRGYLAWSLLDNFEWARGYSKRFGLVYVDYPTQRRIAKTSARWYAGVIAANGPGAAT
jgi:beta-glucosidase